MSELFLQDRVELHCGDCLAVLDTLAENSIDSCVTDPPYHLNFMNRHWDKGDIAFQVGTWRKVLRVLKPGAYLVAFSSTRTFGRMSVAIEDAGFINHPFIAWIFAQGFPKAHRVDDPAWEGWRYGTQSLKPAIEPIYVGQKPFEKALTGTENIKKWGVGALNIDGCRIAAADQDDLTATREQFGKSNIHTKTNIGGRFLTSKEIKPNMTPGRWPANLIHDGSEEVLDVFALAGERPTCSPDHIGQGRDGNHTNGIYGKKASKITTAYGDTGTAARFFYTSKADADDRLGSKHPTVKPLDLMQYLVRLVTPKGGVVLDLFSGTGTTGEAAFREGMRAVLIEREEEYQADIRRRMKLVMAGPDERARESIKEKMKNKPVDAGPLFGSVEQTTMGEGGEVRERAEQKQILRRPRSNRTIGPIGLKW